MPSHHEKLSVIAASHGFSDEAADALVSALTAGHCRQAQFNHRELGGMGQWSLGGMLMIGDMFNDQLKGRVSALIDDLIPLCRLLEDDMEWSPSSRMKPLSSFGAASASGSQNGMRYAIYPDSQKIVIESDGRVKIYDMGGHRIHGISQQQGGSQTLRFVSDQGPVALGDLQMISGTMSDHDHHPPFTGSTHTAMTNAQEDVAEKISRLYSLIEKGMLTQAEFEQAKNRLLDRL